MNLPTPDVEYGLISPMLIVLGAAVLGVVLEAFLPRRLRYPAQVALSLTALVAAFVAVVLVARDLHGGAGFSAVMGAVAVDMPALFLQGTIVLIGVLGILLIGERRIGQPAESAVDQADTADGAESQGLDAFTPQASAIAGSVAEQVATRAGVVQTEVFPLTMFAIGGMLLFPAANDLLTMFIALEVLSLPLYLLCGLARRRRLLSQESALKYFLLGA
ncbi:MAG TPA: proton-conducting transporter membrane subunit, partial [Mycobacterium sp.]